MITTLTPVRALTLALALFAVASTLAATSARAAPRPLPRLVVSENRRFLTTEDGAPFFYLADTAWELFHRLDRKQASDYLDLRARQRFNVIQAVALAEKDGPTVPNAYGDLPLVDEDPARPAVTPGASPRDPAQYDYWDHVEFVVDEANRRGLYVGFLPSWGKWIGDIRKPREIPIFTEESARRYGEFLGKRFGRKGIVWILGGDRLGKGKEPIYRAMAAGIVTGIAGKEDHGAALMTWHPGGGYTSSEWFHDDEWLDFNMQQTGHGPVEKEPTCWTKIGNDYARTPIKPVIDGEPLYEDHPIGFREAPRWGYSLDAHVRQRAYWDVFSGAFGHAYGHHSVWQMFEPGLDGANGPILHWQEALHRPAAAQMQHLRALVESRPFLSRVPDQSLLARNYEKGEHVAATRGDGYAFFYSGQGRPVAVQLGRLRGERLKAHWWNPRNGSAVLIGEVENQGTREFVAPSHGGLGSDWVLVLDELGKGFPPPGARRPPAPTGARVRPGAR
jgi:hypothetical protein